MATYSISKDPTATNLTISKNSSNQVFITKNPGNTKAYFTKSGGTEVSLGKGEPGTPPTSALKFSRNFMSENLTTGVGGTLAFSRASSATYVDSSGVIQSASSGNPRFTHMSASPYTALGLLIEPASENLVTYSEDFSNAGWVGTAAPTLDNGVTAPDGTTGVYYLTDDAAGSAASKNMEMSISAGATKYTASVFVKKETTVTDDFRMDVQFTGGTANTTYVTWNAVTGAPVLTSGTGLVAYGAEEFTDFWRCWLITTDENTDNTSATIKLYPFRAAALTGDRYFWGAQLENNELMTSYIPTSGGTAARTSELLYQNPVTWFNDGGAGTIKISMSFPESTISGWALDTTKSLDILEISTSTPNTTGIRCTIRPDRDTEEFRSKLTESAVTTQDQSLSGFAYTADTSVEWFMSWDASSSRLFADTTFQGTTASPSLPGAVNAIDRIYIGTRSTGTSGWLRGMIQSIEYYSDKQSDPA